MARAKPADLTLIRINSILEDVLALVQQQAIERNIQIEDELDDNIDFIYGDPDQLKQVFLNIVKNSFEAMNEGGKLIIKTHFKAEPAPGWVEVVFADNGPGIKKENLPSLFQPFFTTKLRGTGLGLALCRRIIAERHNGKIFIESEEGKGTIVKLELPKTQGSKVVGEHS